MLAVENKTFEVQAELEVRIANYTHLYEAYSALHRAHTTLRAHNEQMEKTVRGEKESLRAQQAALARDQEWTRRERDRLQAERARLERDRAELEAKWRGLVGERGSTSTTTENSPPRDEAPTVHEGGEAPKTGGEIWWVEISLTSIYNSELGSSGIFQRFH